MNHRRSSALVLLTLLLDTPALAEVLKEGKPSKGFYWQKIKQSNGMVVYQCRSTSDAKFQKAASCEKAGAVQPH
jgi:hypothetical protein